MLKFILKRLGSSLLVLFGASILLFFLVAHSGDPLQDLRESQNPNRETLIAARTEFMGLDQPWYARVLGLAPGHRRLRHRSVRPRPQPERSVRR